VSEFKYFITAEWNKTCCLWRIW